MIARVTPYQPPVAELAARRRVAVAERAALLERRRALLAERRALLAERGALLEILRAQRDVRHAGV